MAKNYAFWPSLQSHFFEIEGWLILHRVFGQG